LKREPTKRCPRCCETKPRSEFDGTYCKPCRKEYNLLYYADHRRGHSLDKAFEPDLGSS
jgi:hypothetical protein